MTFYDLAVRTRLAQFITRVGLNFHPALTGTAYTLPDGSPALTDAEGLRLDADLALFDGDIYEFAWSVMRAGVLDGAAA